MANPIVYWQRSCYTLKGESLQFVRAAFCTFVESAVLTVRKKQERGMGKRLKQWISAVLPYGFLPLLVAFSFNMAVYGGARMIAEDWHHYNVESPLDGLIPFWPPSVAVYLGCYLFWAANYILIARQEKKEICQFFSADFISRAACLVIFLIFPTTNTRPAVEPTGFWNQAMRLVYSVDAADNLFPSIHCLVSWFCYIGLRGRKEIPLWYRFASLVMAVLVCISTLTTKQHVILDVAGGVLLAEICFWIGKKQAVWKTYEKLLDQALGFFTRQKRT